MPLILEPNETLRVVLDRDKKKPVDQQPFFLFRALCCREAKAVVALADSVYDDGVTGCQAVDKLIEAINISLAGWGNMKDPKTGAEIPFKKNELENIITMPEANELMAKIQNQGIGEDELKN